MKLTELLKKITPLPWVAKHHRCGDSLEITNGSVCIVRINGTPIRPIDSNDKANAAMVTHAANVLPELVEALRLMRAFHNDLSKSNPGYMSRLVLQDYGQWNKAMMAMDNAYAHATEVVREQAREIHAVETA